MEILVTPYGVYKQYQFDSEKEFEKCVVTQAETIFGRRCIYVDCKRMIGMHGFERSIPDAYLIDFNSGRAPKLFVVETEMASHDLFQHTSAQLLRFKRSFTSVPRQVKDVLFEEICKDNKTLETCERYAREYGLRNLDNMLDHLVHDDFRALIVIDIGEDELRNVVKDFKFTVDIIEVATYRGERGDHIYQFTPLYRDVTSAKESIEEGEQEHIDVSEFDTIVVPARKDGFHETFIGENRWYAIRIHVSMIPQIKCIAAYQVAPISAITHWALVKDIQPWGDTGKFVVNFVEGAKEIGPIPLVSKSTVKALQGPRYTSSERLQKAKTLGEVF